jgi:hypothetical protein
MTEKQESQWLYAKALELAVLMKGPYEGQHEKNPAGIISHYAPLLREIAKSIREGGKPGNLY